MGRALYRGGGNAELRVARHQTKPGRGPAPAGAAIPGGDPRPLWRRPAGLVVPGNQRWA
jgi:hypothetical protein